jgi:hypothetical protein
LPVSTRIWLLALILSLVVAINSVLLRYRQETGTAILSARSDVVSILQKELRFALSSYLWDKVDFYVHHGEWSEERTGNRVNYYASYMNVPEYRPLLEWSTAVDPSFTEAVAILANSLAVSHGMVERAKGILKRSILDYPNQKRLYRLYGEYGLISYQLEKKFSVAVSFFRKSFQVLNRLPMRQWKAEDRFNIRNYGLSAAKSAFYVKDFELAYQFHKASGFESGSGEFQEKMMSMLHEKGEDGLREKHPLFRGPVKGGKRGANDLAHEDHSGHNHDEGQHTELEAQAKIETEKKLNSSKPVLSSAELRNRSLDRFLYLIPQLKSEYFFPISRTFTIILVVIFLLELTLLILWRGIKRSG